MRLCTQGRGQGYWVSVGLKVAACGPGVAVLGWWGEATQKGQVGGAVAGWWEPMGTNSLLMPSFKGTY